MMLSLLFMVFLILIAGGFLLFQAKGDFYSALKGELHRVFLFPAIFILLFSSILYIPFSYGITNYFLLSQKGEARFSSFFFLLKDGRLLLKAVVLSIYKKLLIYLEGVVLLLSAAILEILLFFSFLLVCGEDLFSVRGDPFSLAADFMIRTPVLILLSVVLWSGVLLGFLLIRLRYIFCKYILLRYNDASPRQAILSGRLASRKHLFQTVSFYLRSAVSYLLVVMTLGRRTFGNRKRFSVYADEQAQRGWHQYCSKRSMRNH